MKKQSLQLHTGVLLLLALLLSAFGANAFDQIGGNVRPEGNAWEYLGGVKINLYSEDGSTLIASTTSAASDDYEFNYDYVNYLITLPEEATAPITYTVKATLDGYEPYEGTITAKSSWMGTSFNGTDIAMRKISAPQCNVTVNVYKNGTDDEVLEGATVTIKQGSTVLYTQETEWDGAVSYTIENPLYTENAYSYEVTRNTYVSQTKEFTIIEGKSEDYFNVYLTRDPDYALTTVLNGTVTYKDGSSNKGLAGATVTILNPAEGEPALGTATTDAGGNYTITVNDVELNRYIGVTCEAEGFVSQSSQVSFKDGKASKNFTMVQQTARLEIYVTDEFTGNRINASATLVESSGYRNNPVRVSDWSNPGATISFTGGQIKRSDLALEIASDDYITKSIQLAGLDLKLNETTVLDQALRPGQLIEGDVENSDNVALTEISVKILDSTGKEVAGTTTDDNGDFRILINDESELLAPGTYSIFIPAPNADYIDYSATFEISEKANPEYMNITLRNNWSIISGTVQDENYTSLAGVTVTLNDGEADVLTAITDSDGAYSLKLTEPKAVKYTLTFAKPDYVTNTCENLTIVLGEDLTVNATLEAKIAYDYEYTDIPVMCDAKWFGCLYNADQTDHKTQAFYTVLGTKALGADGRPYNESVTYAFLTYQKDKVDEADIKPAQGTYVFGADEKAGELVLSSNAHIYKVDGNGNYEWDRDVTDGSLTFTITEEDGDRYCNYDLTLTDEKGRRHHVTYKSRFVEYADESQDASMYLSKDIDATATEAITSFREVNGNTMHLQLTLYSQQNTNSSNPTKCEFTLQTYLPYNRDGLVPGTYSVTPEYSSDFTLVPGEIVNFAGMYYPIGSYVSYIDSGSGVHWGCFKRGTLTVEADGNDRLLMGEFVTVEGFKVAFTYIGSTAISGLPESGLTEDRQLDLTDATGVFEHHGDFYDYGGASTWIIRLTPADGHDDGLMAELSTATWHSAQGIPTGRFRMSTSTSLWPGEYASGRLNDDKTMMSGTWYMSGFDDEGVPSLLAPARGGNLEIEQLADGNYTMKFNFDDGLGHSWEGNWAGKPTIVPMTEEPPYTTGIDNIATGSVRVEGRDIILPAETYITVADMSGRIMFEGETARITLPYPGVYVVTAGTVRFKAAVK